MGPLDFATFLFLLKMQQADRGAQLPHTLSLLRDSNIVTGAIFALLKCFPV